jgi:hypothetical protein
MFGTVAHNESPQPKPEYDGLKEKSFVNTPDGRDLALSKKTVFFNHYKIVFYNHLFWHLHCFYDLFFSVFFNYKKQSKRRQEGIVFFSFKKTENFNE